MSTDEPSAVDEFEARLTWLAREAEEAKADGDWELFHDCREEHSGLLFQYNRKFPPRRRADGNATDTG